MLEQKFAITIWPLKLMVLPFFFIGCQSENPSALASEGEPCAKTDDCDGALRCISKVCVSKSNTELDSDSGVAFASNTGDNIFGTDQIIVVKLVFPDDDFWQLLKNNYETREYLEADLRLTDNSGTNTFSRVGVRLKGNSSILHPGNKKSFKIDFNRFIEDQNYDGLMKLNFSNGFKDPTLLREKIFFDVSRAAGVHAPRTNFANVYFNGSLLGLYTVVEQIDDQFLDWNIMDSNGNLFKAGSNFRADQSEPTLVYYDDHRSSYENAYALKNNEQENNWTDLIEFIDFVNNSSLSVFEDELADRLELQNYLRSVALDNLFSNLDSYTFSARNYYIYHNQTTNKWEWIKWDGNEAFGAYAYGLEPSMITSLPLDFRERPRPLLENIFRSALLYDQYLTEVCYLKKRFFNITYLNSRIGELEELIRDSVYADTNKMYSNEDFDTNLKSDLPDADPLDASAIPGLKSFVREKFDFLNGAADCPIED